MLFQGGALFDSKNVEENVKFPLDLLAKMPRDEKYDRVNLCLNRVGLQNANKKCHPNLAGYEKTMSGLHAP